MRGKVPPSRLWAIAAYFNPVPYRRRLANYRIFRERLAVPLLTVELAYGRIPELGAGDADILVQLRGGDVMWQKERLLNIALARLPAGCDRIAWIDCDVVFADDDWPEHLDRMLDETPLVQAFARVHYLTPDWEPGMPPERAVDVTRVGICRAVADGMPPAAALIRSPTARPTMPAAGLAWGARRELLERHGFYDAGISGGGDRLMASAVYRRFDEIWSQHHMNAPRRDHYRAWGEAWAGAVGGSVASLDTDIFNQWHGDMSARGHGERHRRVTDLGYDPFTDIALDDAGAWRWSSDKPALHACLRDYFLSRREDDVPPTTG